MLAVEVRRHPRGRVYRLRMERDGSRLLLSLPARASIERAMDWARGQQEWLREQRERSISPVMLSDGAVFPLEGSETRIVWDAPASRVPALGPGRLMVGGPAESVGGRVLRWLKARALETLTRETRELAAREGLRVASVAVADPRSRWGSCAASGAIRYSWRLILAPPDVRRATVAHEVAHLLHMDHSPAFHAAHARMLGSNPASARAWLRRYGASLHAYRA